MRAQSKLARLLCCLAALILPAQAVLAQSILRDAETEALLNDMAAPIVEASGLEPQNVDIVLINDNSVNAFVAGGQAVYINSGLINTATSANEVQGVIAHELGHVTGGHAVLNLGAKEATGISILSLLLGAAAAAMWAAPRVFRAGMLRYGQRLAPRHVVAALRTGGR